ncbi:MFS transporter [Pseudomonas sp. BIGb0427]|uniref:MFS transporter n=1 Tax=unclassified Pseudomonas TaxID=196821 RepID=UPI0005EBA8F4|nr:MULTISPECIES: MFS transporter [unclassified Pseudomonas]KJK16283.1 MFS transporter [Pseudomonas sp. 2(2015)]QPG64442.1 MFS transporter [Pseudomonas sp. BIGb0427]QVM96812.1 MFS transporter [Pseudomonas sp. SORT22]UVL56328.1 MFS transporter [Pseudomonas sp. B21-035]UVL61617.1 MFS transporter [Pseudomonas sp. B21-032]
MTSVPGSIAQPSRPLTRSDYKTLSLSALGGALEFYDFIIFVFFATVVGKLFFPAEMPEWLRLMQTFGIFAAGYLARPLGGIVMAHFGDLLGRKKMFTLSIFMMAVPTLIMGLLPTYAQIGLWAPILLLVMRVIQGAAIGGEVPGAWVFVSEHVPARNTGYACGTLTAGLTAGILLGSLVATLINTVYSQQEVADYAWRIPFLLGGVFGLFAVYLRRWLHETPVFAEMQARKALAEEVPLRAVLRDHRGAIVLSMLLTWLLSAGIVVVILMTPALLQSLYQVSPTDSLKANSLAIVLLSLGCIGTGALADRFGAGRVFIVGSLALLVTSWTFYHTLPTHPEWLFPLYALTGLCVGIVGAVPYVMVKAFPPVVRFSGLSFSYNLAYAIFGGLTPMAVTAMLKFSPMAPAYYVAGICTIGLLVGIYLTAKKR